MEVNTSNVYRSEEQKHINDLFWFENPSILWNPSRLIEFIPTSDMNTNEKLNALSRFSLYLTIILFIVYRNYNLFFIAIISIFIIYIIYYNENKNQIKTQEEFDSKIKETLGINPSTPIKVNENGDICQLPTPNNPFMNVLLTDYTDNPNRPPACSYNDEEAKQLTNKYFNYNLYKDVDDIWDRNNSQWAYYTTPNTMIPYDRESFIKWCWKTKYVCRDGNVDHCYPNEDLRVPDNQLQP